MPDVAKENLEPGLHYAMAPVGLLKGHRQVDQAASDLDIATFLGHLLHGEVLPSIADYHDEDLQDELVDYADQVTDKLSDSSLGKPLAPSLANWKTYNLPVVVDAWHRGEEAPASVFALAALAAFASGTGFDTEKVPSGFAVNDDEATIESIRNAFPGAEATESQLADWFRAIIEVGGFFADDAPQQREELTGRLAAEAASYAQIILSEGVKTALKATFQ